MWTSTRHRKIHWWKLTSHSIVNQYFWTENYKASQVQNVPTFGCRPVLILTPRQLPLMYTDVSECFIWWNGFTKNLPINPSESLTCTYTFWPWFTLAEKKMNLFWKLVFTPLWEPSWMSFKETAESLSRTVQSKWTVPLATPHSPLEDSQQASLSPNVLNVTCISHVIEKNPRSGEAPCRHACSTEELPASACMRNMMEHKP